ncbi:MAG: DNA ligase [Pseudomonadota bacterium]
MTNTSSAQSSHIGIGLSRRQFSLVLGAIGATGFTARTSAAEAPALMLAKVYQQGAALDAFWVSEKYDGVRGYWDGHQLLTRGGERVFAPAWFTAGWPASPMDGELWAGHGQFQKAVSTVRQQTPDESAWRGIRFMVFDLPAQPGPFTQRKDALNLLVGPRTRPWVVPVSQTKLPHHEALVKLLQTTVAAGGEGLMLHRADSLYRGVRSDDLLKFKPYEDAEARVIAHISGQGKHSAVMGALLVEMLSPAGQVPPRFKLGTGFSDAQRRNPPAVGALVTYRFRGVTGSGIPRFASFMRLHEDL